METSAIPVHGAASLATPTSLIALDAVYRRGVTPGVMTFGEIQQRQLNGAPSDSLLVMSLGVLKFLATDVQAVIDVADGLTASKEAQLVLGTPGNTTHEVTTTGDALTDVFDAASGAALSEALITTRKPKSSLVTIWDNIAEAAKLANKHVLVIVTREEGTFRILQDTEGNIATKYAALVAAKGSTGCFTTIDATAPSAGSASIVYLR